MNKNRDKIMDKVGVPDSKRKDTASLFLMALLLICITTGLVRGIKMEPRNPTRHFSPKKQYPSTGFEK